MFNVKRNGASVEITEIPASIPFSAFKNIADDTGAIECLICFHKGKEDYEVIIQQTNEDMAATVVWLASGEKEKLSRVSTNTEKPNLDMIPSESKNIDAEIKEYLCTECGEKMSEHVFAMFPEKSWTKEQLDEWKANRNKEAMLAGLFILRTRTVLAELIEKLHTIDDRFAKAPVSGGFMRNLKIGLRADVKEISAKLMSLM
ncbi:hypothetical protein RDB90_004842 [Salmonella enterica]|nr:hypothetical protein [Salmonella enterica]